MEDLRPHSLDGILGQPSAISRLQRLAEGVRAGRIVPTHLLLHGPPGVGKTTAARAFGREVLQDDWENSFHELAASDDRGIQFLRAQIFPLLRLKPSRQAPFRIIFFDEADSMTPEAQAALRPALEAEAATCVFLLACNQLDGLSKPLRSRLTRLDFAPLPPEGMRRVLDEALSKTSFSLDGAALDSIVERAGGIPREAIKLLIEEHGSPLAVA